MTIAGRWPQVGDLAVDIFVTAGGRDVLGPVVTVKDIRGHQILTTSGGWYERTTFAPVGSPHSTHRLSPVTADRVLVARGREHLAALVTLTTNLSDLDHRTPESVIAALAQVIATANDSRVALLGLMAEASRAEQESDR